LHYKDKLFNEKNTVCADENFFSVFSLKVTKGDKNSALNEPYAIMMTADVAKKYFGDHKALGKTLKKNNGDYVTVTGVLADIPTNSHLQFDFIMPLTHEINTDVRDNVYSSFTFYQTSPDALVLGLGRRRLVMFDLGMDTKQAFHDLLGGPNPRLAGEHCCHCGHLLPIGLLPLGSPNGAFVAGWLDDGNALAVNGDDEDRSGRRGRVGGALGVAVGLGLAQLHIGPLRPVVSFGSIIVSFVVSALVGIFFGAYPANRAAKLTPIEALRYE